MLHYITSFCLVRPRLPVQYRNRLSLQQLHRFSIMQLYSSRKTLTWGRFGGGYLSRFIVGSGRQL